MRGGPEPLLSGHAEVGDKDDCNAAATRPTGWYESDPPGGGHSVARVVAMLQDVVRSIGGMLDILANDGDEKMVQAVVKNGAVAKNG